MIAISSSSVMNRGLGRVRATRAPWWWVLCMACGMFAAGACTGSISGDPKPDSATARPSRFGRLVMDRLRTLSSGTVTLTPQAAPVVRAVRAAPVATVAVPLAVAVVARAVVALAVAVVARAVVALAVAVAWLERW